MTGEQQAIVASSQHGDRTGYEGSRKAVLVVDDVRQSRTLLLDTLDQLGFDVSGASNGAECLECVRAAKPDLIIMDHAGAHAFISKPIEQEELLAMVGRLMRLTWTCRDIQPQPAGQAEPGDADLVYPPWEEMVALRRLARMGNMRSLCERSAYLKGLDARYAPFAARLARLAERYQSKAIVTLIERDSGPRGDR